MNFSEEWDKLKSLEIGKDITTIRWNDYPLKGIGKIEPIKLSGKLIAKAKLIGIEFTIMDKLTLDFIQYDTKKDFTKLKFFQMMSQWYSRKPDWRGWNSNVNIYYLKITEVM